MHELISDIILHEWNQFDQVQNEGGRAGCQDDWKTFRIMRSSQFQEWPKELLTSYLNDLIDAESRGWNMITEKYARMMKSTAPARYAELEPSLPARSRGRLAAQEEIIAIETDWNEEFHRAFPRYSSGSRLIRTEDDTPYETSAETYLRGELTTYSDQTFALYADMVRGLQAAGRSRAYDVAQNIARQYGYTSLEELEALL